MTATKLKARKIELLVIDQDPILDDAGNVIRKPKPVSLRDIIADAMYIAKGGSQQGMDWKEMRERKPLLDKIEEAKEPGFLIVDEKEWEEMKMLWEKSKRNAFNKMVYAAGMALFDAEEIELKEVKGEKEKTGG